MNSSVKDIIYSAIIGDASGYTLGGMKSAHIKAVFKDQEGYLDPAPALKNNMERWRKPGLYSSISQFMLIAASSVEKRIFRMDKFIEGVKKAPEHLESGFSFFRDTGPAEESFLMSARGEKREPFAVYTRSCARILPVSIPLLFTENGNSLLSDTLKLVSLFTTDTATASRTYIFLNLLKDLLFSEGRGFFLECVLESVNNSYDYIRDNEHRIFDSGYNPGSFSEEVRIFAELISMLQKVKDKGSAEKIICESVNMRLKSPVARGSVNLSETVLPYAIMISALTMPHNAVFHEASREGGAASALASLSAALTTAFYGPGIPDELKDTLVNKKKLNSMVDLLDAESSRGDIISILYESEPGLTSKEAEEFRARNKKEPKKQAPPKTRRDAESELTKHVVESWTKVDKARWRRERGKHDA